jgi:hypothetical protein
MDTDWTENLTPAEAQAAIDALKAHKGAELLKLRRALQTKACRREPECVPAPQGRWDNVFRE